MWMVTIFILCLSISIIWFSLTIPIPLDPSQPSAVDLEAKQQGIAMISNDVLDLMEANPFDSVGIYTIRSNGERHATFIPPWNDITYSLGMTGSKRDYFIVRKVFEALEANGLISIGVYPLAKPDHLKV